MTTSAVRAVILVPVALVLAACTSGSDDCDEAAALASCIYIAEVEGVTYVDQALARPVPRRMLGKTVAGTMPPCTSPVIDDDCAGAPPRPTPAPITLRRIKGIPKNWALIDDEYVGRKSLLVPAGDKMEPDYTGAPESLELLVERGMPRNYDSPFD